MKNFIPAIRTDRYREMKVYEEKGYVIQDKRGYLKIDQISLYYLNKKHIYGVEVTNNEVYFYINKERSNIYLSIIEIYEILCGIYKENGKLFINDLKRQLFNKRIEDTFIYKDIEYKRASLVDLTVDGEVEIPLTKLCVTYAELFVLINLIQEKSNALFMRSTGAKKKYKNGILRLLIVLCEKNENIALLQKMGWNWDVKEQRYKYLKPKEESVRTKYKYYLTSDEYDNIMELKKS